MVEVVREDPLGSGSKGRVGEALCRKADQLQARACWGVGGSRRERSRGRLGSSGCVALDWAFRLQSTVPALCLSLCAPAGGRGGDCQPV